MTTTNSNLSLSRWQKNGRDRLYVNGLGLCGASRLWIEPDRSGRLDIRGNYENEARFREDFNEVAEFVAAMTGKTFFGIKYDDLTN